MTVNRTGGGDRDPLIDVGIDGDEDEGVRAVLAALEAAGAKAGEAPDEDVVARIVTAVSSERRSILQQRAVGNRGWTARPRRRWAGRGPSNVPIAWMGGLAAAAVVIVVLLSGPDVVNSVRVVPVEAGSSAGNGDDVASGPNRGARGQPTSTAGVVQTMEVSGQAASSEARSTTAAAGGASPNATDNPDSPPSNIDPPLSTSTTGQSPDTTVSGPSSITAVSAPATTAPPPLTKTSDSTISSRPGYQTHAYAVGNAGSVTVSFNDDHLIVEDVVVAPGWAYQAGSRTSRFADIVFVGPDHDATFTIKVGSGGLKIDLDPGTDRSSTAQVVKAYQVGKAGAVTIRYSDVAIAVDSVTPNRGWRYQFGTQSSGLTDIRFTGDDDDDSATFTAKVDKGILQIVASVSLDD